MRLASLDKARQALAMGIGEYSRNLKHMGRVPVGSGPDTSPIRVTEGDALRLLA